MQRTSKRPLNGAPARYKPELILVYRGFNTGGIETLIVRWANELARSGRKVIVAIHGGELESILDRKVALVRYVNSADLARRLRMLDIDWPHAAFFSFDPTSAYTVTRVRLALQGGDRLPHVSGVYHPRAYFDFERRYQQELNGQLLLQLYSDSLVFCNEDCRKSHESFYGVDLSRAEVLAVPVTLRPSRWCPPAGDLRILSVGRLTRFKAYNWAVPAMVASLRGSGLDCRWDIWGEDDCNGEKQEIGEEIARTGVDEFVRLRSTAPYAQLPDILASSHLFVGMGTSALEAAMTGVPTIVACDEEPERCYGFLFDLPFGNFGERLAYPPGETIPHLIRRFAAMSNAEKTELSERCRDVALKHSLPSFIERVDRKLGAMQEQPASATLKALAITHRFRELKDRALGKAGPVLAMIKEKPIAAAALPLSSLHVPPSVSFSVVQGTPLVSFVMLSYRQERLVRDAVRGALAQDYPNLEIILSDDCSPDGTYAAIQEEVAGYDGPHRVVTRQTRRNLGLIPHLYDAVAGAGGKLLVVGAGDDISQPHRVSRLVEAWQASGADALCSGWQSIDDRNHVTGQGVQAKSDLRIERYFPDGEVWQIGGATAAYTPEVFREVPCPGTLFAEDFYLTLALRWRGRKIVYVPDPLVHYRVHADAMTSKRPIDLEAEEVEVRLWSSRMAATLRHFATEVREGQVRSGAWAPARAVDLGAIEEDIAYNLVRAKWMKLSVSKRLAAFRQFGSAAKRRWMLPRLFGLRPVALARSLRSTLRRDQHG